jgi:[ribosomal protein S5]-alanine N-acetyltransferase
MVGPDWLGAVGVPREVGVVELQTDRLAIRNFVPDDWKTLQEMAIQYQSSESARYEAPWPTSTEDIKALIRWFDSRDDYLAVCLLATGELIGLVAINRRKGRAGRVHNLGYVFHPAYQGQGYATEACQAAMAYLFGPLEADGILSGTSSANKASKRLLHRLGLAQIAAGEFALSRAEWLAAGQAQGGGSLPGACAEEALLDGRDPQ